MELFLPKDKGSLGNVVIMGFVFTNFQADNYGTSSGDDEGNCAYNWTGGEISQHKYCRYGWGQAYENNRNIKGGEWSLRFGVQALMGGGGGLSGMALRADFEII